MDLKNLSFALYGTGAVFALIGWIFLKVERRIKNYNLVEVMNEIHSDSIGYASIGGVLLLLAIFLYSF